MVISTGDRVRENTSEAVNEEIRSRTAANVARVVEAGQAAIVERLQALDQEWDIERYIETVAPSISLAGMTLGLTTNRKWFALPILVQSFLLQHAIQGWCPPIPILRRLGIRTSSEIDEERNALKAVRGDYRQVVGQNGQLVSVALAAAQHSS
ncbi:MAG: hypothetical protein JWN70_4107 [Planctomycetaceae bacterium]|nr:hypothetical protein [Planctomycetaceae bacterium]